ncbi:MAG: hypothetical protein IJO52_00275, partial [Clostridia bacterium]|nr:hypothetical protein [Clostridia bacterium]
MKKNISIMLAAILCLSFISGCSGSGYDFFDFNVKKYVEVGEIFGVEYEEQSLDVTDADVDAYINYELSQKGYGEEKKITG